MFLALNNITRTSDATDTVFLNQAGLSSRQAVRVTTHVSAARNNSVCSLVDWLCAGRVVAQLAMAQVSNTACK